MRLPLKSGASGGTQAWVDFCPASICSNMSTKPFSPRQYCWGTLHLSEQWLAMFPSLRPEQLSLEPRKAGILAWPPLNPTALPAAFCCLALTQPFTTWFWCGCRRRDSQGIRDFQGIRNQIETAKKTQMPSLVYIPYSSKLVYTLASLVLLEKFHQSPPFQKRCESFFILFTYAVIEIILSAATHISLYTSFPLKLHLLHTCIFSFLFLALLVVFGCTWEFFQ